MKLKAITGIMLTLLLIGMLTLVFGIQPVEAEPKTIRVPTDYRTIQEAINAADVGDAIYVYNGTYYENVVVNKTVSLVGEDKSITIIDGGGTGTVINLTANDISISGFTIQNSGPDWLCNGIYLDYVNSCNISDNIITNNYFGIRLFASSNNILISNAVTNNTLYGILLDGSDGNILRDNSMTGNMYNFGVVGLGLFQFIQDIDVSNTVDGKTVYYMINQDDLVIDPSTFPDIGYLGLVNSTNITVKNLTLTNNGQGVLFAWTTDSTIENVNAKNNYDDIGLFKCGGNIINNNTIVNSAYAGIHLYYSSSNEITDNIISNNVWGIYSYYSSGNNITRNTMMSNNMEGIMLHWYSNDNTIIINNITKNGGGITTDGSSGNIIICNTIASNDWDGVQLAYDSRYNTIISNTITNSTSLLYGDGIRIFESTYNTITNNNITNNRRYGIWLRNSSDNTIYHNNFINNLIQAYLEDSATNTWNDGYPSGGNYWSDYTGVDLYSGPYQNETGRDGIGDTPYLIDENNRDNYPLMNPYIPPEEMRVLYYELLRKYNELLADFDSLNSTYWELLNEYGELLTSYNTLNSTYYSLVYDYTELQGNYNALNITYYELVTSYNNLQANYNLLNSTYNELKSKQEATISELNNIRNLMYIFIATTIILIAITIYLVKRKTLTTKASMLNTKEVTSHFFV